MNAQWFEVSGKVLKPVMSMRCRVLVIGGRVAASGHGELSLGALWDTEKVYLEEIGWTVRELSENET